MQGIADVFLSRKSYKEIERNDKKKFNLPHTLKEENLFHSYRVNPI